MSGSFTDDSSKKMDQLGKEYAEVKVKLQKIPIHQDIDPDTGRWTAGSKKGKLYKTRIRTNRKQLATIPIHQDINPDTGEWITGTVLNKKHNTKAKGDKQARQRARVQQDATSANQNPSGNGGRKMRVKINPHR